LADGPSREIPKQEYDGGGKTATAASRVTEIALALENQPGERPANVAASQS
jgi:hypothetical protein